MTEATDSTHDNHHFANIRDPAGVVYPYDITEFFVGGTARHGARRWSGDFEGRPGLASQFKQFLEKDQMSDVTVKKRVGSFRHFCRFLDERDDLPYVGDLSDLTEVHGPQLKRWLSDRKITSPDVYKNIKMFVVEGRATAGLPLLIWPARDPDRPSEVPEPDYVGIQRLNMALRKEAREVAATFGEGARLAAEGRDPRVGDGRAAAWSDPMNQAWLIRQLTTETIPLKDELSTYHATGLLSSANGIVPGPSYLPPTMSSRGSEGYVGKLRWFYPGLYDTAIYFWLVALHTGWNLATQIGIDVSEREAWREDHPHAPDRVLMHAWKERANRHQQAICNPKAEFHPPAIIEMLVERTAPLRRSLVQRLEALRDQYAQKPNPTLARKIKKLEEGAKSPWLFVSLGKGGEIGWFTSTKSVSALNRFIRAVALKHNLVGDHPFLRTVSTSQARDAWIMPT